MKDLGGCRVGIVLGAGHGRTAIRVGVDRIAGRPRPGRGVDRPFDGGRPVIGFRQDRVRNVRQRSNGQIEVVSKAQS